LSSSISPFIYFFLYHHHHHHHHHCYRPLYCLRRYELCSILLRISLQ
jgi:hypothetical protein